MVVRRLDQPYSGDATVALAPQRGFHERPSYPVVLGGRIDRDGAEARDRVALVDERTPHYLARVTWTPERLLDDLERLALRAPTRVDFFDEAALRLKKVVPFDGACWHTLDPGSNLITQHHLQDLPDRFPVLANNEYAVEDVN